MTNVYEEVSKKLNELEGKIETYLNKGKGNPYHDKLGRFTTGSGKSGARDDKSGKKGGSFSYDKKKVAKIMEGDSDWGDLVHEIAERADKIKSETKGYGTPRGLSDFEALPSKLLEDLNLTDKPSVSEAQAIAEILSEKGVISRKKKISK